jgi:uncharacterized protein (UPF0333 family)
MTTLYFLALDAAKNLELSRQHIKFWETAREYVVGGSAEGADLITKSVDGPVKLLFLVGIVAISMTLFWQAGFQTAKDGPLSVFITAGPQLAWVILVVFLLANSYSNAYKIANSTWRFRTLMRDRTQTIVFANSQISNAIANEIYYARFGQAVSEQLAECRGMPFPAARVPQAVRPGPGAEIPLEQSQTYDFLECLKTLQSEVQSSYTALQKDCGKDLQNCRILQDKARNLSKEVSDGVERIEKAFVNTGSSDRPYFGPDGRAGGLDDPLVVGEDFSAIGDAIAAALSSVGEFVYINLVELGNTVYTASIEVLFMLGGLFFPITIAWSLIPGKRQILLDWFVGILSITISEQIYLILIGVVAVLAGLPQFQEFGPRLFLITIGILGPILATVGGGVSGLAMARTYRGAAIGSVGAALSVASGAAFTIAYRANARRQLGRA